MSSRQPASEEEPLLGALAAAGAPATSIWDWSAGATPAAAVGILIDWLPRIDPTQVRLREGIVRALTTSAARPAAAAVIAAEMRRQARHGSPWVVLWVYGNALAVVADDTVLAEVAALARDRTLGRAREMLTDALSRMPSPRALQELLDLLADPDIGGHAVVALSRRPDAPPEAFTAFTADPRPWVRRAARQVATGRLGNT